MKDLNNNNIKNWRLFGGLEMINDIKVIWFIKITFNHMIIWSCDHNIIKTLSKLLLIAQLKI